MDLRPSELDTQVASLVGGAAVVALVPATEDRTWAAAMAWRIARTLAATGRKTALVDCFVHEPVLHEVIGAPNDEGIVDAFEYGASLQRIVQQQPGANLFFIPAGTYSAEPEQLTAHPRWRRLSAGFRHEDALLLLFCADGSLSDLAAQPDGMIVLAPEGMAQAATQWPALAVALGSGKPPLLGVVLDEPPVTAPAAAVAAAPAPAAVAAEPADAVAAPAPAPGAAAPEAAAPEAAEPAAAPPRRSRPRRSRASAPMAMIIEQPRGPGVGLWLTLLVLAAAAVGAWFYRAPLLALAGIGAAAAPATTAAAAPRAPVAEPLPFVVLVSQWGSLRDAFRVNDTLELRGVHALLTPVRLQGRVWYRIYAGPAATRAAADSLLAGLRGRGLLAADGGEVLELPLSIALPGSFTPAQADGERARLREAGVPSFVLGQADGGYRLFAGAFDAASAAVLLQNDVLTPAGGTGTLGPRVGFVP